MRVSNSEKLSIASQSIEALIALLVQTHGNTTEYWTRLLLNTKLYKDIRNVKTGLWHESTMYLYDELLREMNGGVLPVG